jgi:3-oxocholest-4-en-26-oyl-CoA dehydrogenase beta subunit
MDFSFSEEQAALADLAGRIFREHADSPAATRADDTGMHRELWQELARAELLGLALPAEVGGGGLGFLELVLLLERAGHAGARVPLHPTLVLGALPIARFGSNEQKLGLRAVTSGERVLSAALVDSGKAVRAVPAGAGFRLEGARDCIPALELASQVLVPALDDAERLTLFIVDPRAKGTRIQHQTPTNGEPLGRLELDGVSVTAGDVLGGRGDGAEIVAWMLDHARAGLCGLALGAAQRALELTARYTSERQQFGRAIATFQAVSQRAADAYVDVEIMRLTTWRAAWLLGQGRTAAAECAVAKFFAAEAGRRVVNAAQHLHGGIGFDRSYPLYRYFLCQRQIEFTLGSATRELTRLGSMLAAGE